MISPDSLIAEGVTVYQYASVVRGSSVGRSTSIGPCALVDSAVVGSHCKIGHAAAIHPGTQIGDRVFIGPGVIFCNDLWPEVSLQGFDADNVIIRVCDDASIGAGAIVMPGVEIGQGALIAAGAIVLRSVPAVRLYTREGDLMDIPADRRERRARAC